MGINKYSSSTQSQFKLANIAFLEGRYEDAISLYQSLLQDNSQFYKCLSLNIQLARMAQGKHVDISNALNVLVHSGEINFLDCQIGNGLEKEDSGSNTFKSLNHDPFFISSSSADLSMLEGWYEIHISISSNLKNNLAKVYVDYGDGFKEDESVSIPYKDKTLTKRIMHFRAMPIAIRFDPLESKNHFEISELSLIKLDSVTAKERVINFVIQNIPKESSAVSATFKDENNLSTDDLLLNVYKTIYKPYFLITNQKNSLSYLRWIEDVEEAEIPGRVIIKEKILTFERQPLLSILIPTYNTDLDFLRECLNSVLDQTYSHWEMCIADDSSPNNEVREMLIQYAANDSRIKLEFRKVNGGICEASNTALSLANGEFIVLLDHDDLLAREALFFLVEAINKFPSAEIIYTDEDKVDVLGQRFEPHFKSDFNLDLLYSHNYVSHLGAYRRDLMKTVGGFRKGLEGAQDYDLLLRCLLKADVANIIHIPRICYHWRAHTSSTALNVASKSYTSKAGLKALIDHFEAKGQNAEINMSVTPNTYRIAWPLPKDSPLVSLIIPTRDGLELLTVCIDSILKKTTYQNYEIIIVDNDSIEPQTLSYFTRIQASDPRVRVIQFKGDFNYSALNNWAVTQSRGEIIGLINNDIEVIGSNWLTEMVSHAIRSEIGCVGAKLYYPNFKIQHAGVIIGLGGVAGHSHKHFDGNHPGYFKRLILAQNLSAVTAACLLVRKSVYQEAEGLEEINLRVAFNDIDFCLKVRGLGYTNLWTPFAELYHHESATRGDDLSPEKRERFKSEVLHMKEKWSDELLLDPYYNKNLTLDREDFTPNF